MKKLRSCFLLILLMLAVAAFTACGQSTAPDAADSGSMTEAAADVQDNDAHAQALDAQATEGQPEEPDPIGRGTLPSLHIGLPASRIHRNNWNAATVSLRDAGDYSFAAVVAQVRGRGNSTWRYMGEKRPLRIRFSDARPMFGSDYAARDWVLIANANDYSLMRNFAAHFLSSLLCSQDFAPAHRFVHLYLDGEYRGVYMLSDQIQVHEGRVELTAHEDPALSEYFLEWCRHPKAEGDVYFRVGEGNSPFELPFPGNRYLTGAHIQWANNFMNEVDAAIRAMDFAAMEALVDMPSFVDMYLVHEFFKNADVGFSSMFFQIRQGPGGPRLYYGPFWDFDQTAGNTFTSGWYTDYSPQRMWAGFANHWLTSLVIMPETRALIAERWEQLRDNEIAGMIAHLEYTALRYQECFERNFVRWPNKLGNYLWRTPLTVQAIPTFMGQVEYLTDWFRQRSVWMDGFLLG